jgi:hypothetical protein
MRPFLILLAVLAPLPLEAAAPGPGEEAVRHPRVRVTAPSLPGGRLSGILVSLDETTLRIEREEGNPPIAVPRTSITKLETSRRGSRKAAGAGIGALFGLATALVVGLTAGEDCPDTPGDDPFARLAVAFCFNRTETTGLVGVLTVPAGMLLGVLAAPGEKWEASTTDRLRVAAAPTRGGGVRAALTIRF